jgi:hypothetical protein
MHPTKKAQGPGRYQFFISETLQQNGFLLSQYLTGPGNEETAFRDVDDLCFCVINA